MKNVIVVLLVTSLVIAFAVYLSVWSWFYLFFMAKYSNGIRIGVGLAVIGILSFMIYIVWRKLKRLDKECPH